MQVVEGDSCSGTRERSVSCLCIRHCSKIDLHDRLLFPTDTERRSSRCHPAPQPIEGSWRSSLTACRRRSMRGCSHSSSRSSRCLDSRCALLRFSLEPDGLLVLKPRDRRRDLDTQPATLRGPMVAKVLSAHAYHAGEGVLINDIAEQAGPSDHCPLGASVFLWSRHQVRCSSAWWVRHSHTTSSGLL